MQWLGALLGYPDVIQEKRVLDADHFASLSLPTGEQWQVESDKAPERSEEYNMENISFGTPVVVV